MSNDDGGHLYQHPPCLDMSSSVAVLFLAELLPSRAPVCFKLLGKITKPLKTDKIHLLKNSLQNEP